MTGYDIGERVLSAMYRRDFSGWTRDDSSPFRTRFLINIEPCLSLTAEVSGRDPFLAPRFGVEADDGVSFDASGLVPVGTSRGCLIFKGVGCEVTMPIDDKADARRIIGRGIAAREDISDGPAPIWFSETTDGTMPTTPPRFINPDLEDVLALLATGITDGVYGAYGSGMSVSVAEGEDAFMQPIVSLGVRYGRVSVTVTGRIMRVRSGVSIFSDDAEVFVPVPDESFDLERSGIPREVQSTSQYMAENPPPSFDDVVEARRGEIEPTPGEADSDEPAH